MFLGSFTEVSIVFKKVSRMSQEVSTVSEKSLKGVSWKFQGSFKGVLRVF